MANRKRSLQTKTNDRRKKKSYPGLLQEYDIQSAEDSPGTAVCV